MVAAPRPRQCVILAGGLGTRLGALANGAPKPLALVGGAPFLDHLLWRARRMAYEKVLLLAGHWSHAVVDYARSRSSGEMALEVSVEPCPLGTAGALHFARDRLDERFLMLNGDSLFDFNWRRLELAVAAHDAGMALRWADDATRFGVVGLSGIQVSQFDPCGTAEGGLINGGVYVLSNTIANEAPDCGSLEREVFPALAAQGRLVGQRFEGTFLDIGVPADFARAQTVVPGTRRRGALFLLPGAGTAPPAGSALEAAARAVAAANDEARYAFLICNGANAPELSALVALLERCGGFLDDAFTVPGSERIEGAERLSLLAAAAARRGWAVENADLLVETLH